MRRLLTAFLCLFLAGPAFAAGIGIQGGPVVPTVSAGTPTASACINSAGTLITNGASANCFAGAGGVTAGGSNAFTGTNSFSALTTFTTDPLVSSGGSSTDGAIFFGTNSGTRYVAYDSTTGGTGGYSVGNTFGSSDTLYTGPIALNNAGLSRITLKAPGSGVWTLTLPTTGGTNTYLLSTNGSGTTSWVAPNLGTVTSVGCGTNMTGGTITTSGTCNVPTATTSTTGATTLASAAQTCAGSSTTNAVTPSSLAVSAGSGQGYICIGGLYHEFGLVTSTGGGAYSITLPHSVSGVYSFVATPGGLHIAPASSCSGTTCTGVVYDLSGTGASGVNVFWMMDGT